MASLSCFLTSPKEEKKKMALPETNNEGADGSKSWKRADKPTTSDVDTDAVLDDSDYEDLYANEISASEKVPLRRHAMKRKAYEEKRNLRKHSLTKRKKCYRGEFNFSQKNLSIEILPQRQMRKVMPYLLTNRLKNRSKN